MRAPDVAVALDMPLVDAAVGPVRRFQPVRSLVGIGARLAGQPETVARPGAELARGLGRVVSSG